MPSDMVVSLPKRLKHPLESREDPYAGVFGAQVHEEV